MQKGSRSGRSNAPGKGIHRLSEELRATVSNLRALTEKNILKKVYKFVEICYNIK